MTADYDTDTVRWSERQSSPHWQAEARSFRAQARRDEVGRGTSTHDGLSIAQACMEYLHDQIGCRTLFATLFHELAEAAEGMEHAACMAMDAAPGNHEEMFAYRIVPGRAGQSYGLEVAAATGMPPTVLSRAAAVALPKRMRPANR